MLSTQWNPLLIGSRTTLTYESVDGYQGTLYLFEPKKPADHPLPVVVYFHGGSLLEGSARISPGRNAERNG